MNRLFAPLALAALVLAAPAFAHSHLKRAMPAAGSTVTPAPAEVVLSFTESLEPKFSTVEVHDAKGAAVHAGAAEAGPERTQLRVPLKPLPPGRYKVTWRVLSVDTHRVNGSFSFTVGR